MLARVTLGISVLALASGVGALGLLIHGLRQMAQILKSPEPRVDKGQLSFDHDAPASLLGAPGIPETEIRTTSGTVGYIDNLGVLRTSGRFTPESNDSAGGAQIIPLHGPGE